jgi:hypothetical protein
VSTRPEHCTHWDEGDGDCCECGEPNWCPDDGNTPEALAQYEERRLTCATTEVDT